MDSEYLREVVCPQSLGWRMSSNEVAEASEWLFGRSLCFCHWTYVAILRGGGQILTITDALSAFVLVGACKREVRNQSQLGEVFLSSSLELHTDNHPEYLCAFIADL